MSNSHWRTRSASRRVIQLLMLVLASCKQGTTEAVLDCLIGSSTCRPPIPKTPVVIVQSPSGTSLRAGQSVQLEATLYDTLGRATSGRTFEWSSGDPTHAAVSASGRVTALGTGLVNIFATARPDGIRGFLELQITPGSVASLAITPPSVSIPRGESRTVVARALDSLGNVVPQSAIAWSSDDATLASVSSTGVVTGISLGGPVRVVATSSGTSASILVTIVPSAPLTFVQLALGMEHTCALSSTGQAYCWGNNQYGQLGDSITVNRPMFGRVLQGTLAFVELSAGDSHSCGRTAQGEVYCWGGGGPQGILGDGSQRNYPYPVAVAQGSVRFVSIAAGGRRTCALTASGAAYCWGSNTGGVGDSTGVELRGTPVRVAQGNLSFVALSAGQSLGCARSQVGRLYCWGSNNSGVFDDSLVTKAQAPIAVRQGMEGFTSLAISAEHACALGANATLTCWGKAYRPSSSPSTIAFPAATPPSGALFRSLGTAGLGFQCALTTQSRAACWGRNELGQLGEGTSTEEWRQARYTQLASAVAGVGAGALHACAWTAAHAWCWGGNRSGQLGDGTTVDRAVPVVVRH